MERRLGKFILAALAHGIILLVVDVITLSLMSFGAGQDSLGVFSVMVHFFFCMGYFLVVWVKLYSYDYNYFLSYSRDIVVRGLVTTGGFVFGMVVASYLILRLLPQTSVGSLLFPAERFFAVVLVVLAADVLGFLALYALQYLWIRHLIGLGYLKKNLLVIGEPDDRFPLTGIESSGRTKIFQGRLFKRGATWYFRDSRHAVTCLNYRQIPNLFFEMKIGEVVIFLCKSISQKDVDTLISYLTENSINYYLVPDIEKLSRTTFQASAFPYVPIIKKYTTKRDSVTQITLKRFLDIILVSLSLLLVVPLRLLVALLIKLDDGGPVFYTHERVGKNGKIIRFFKFRSMEVDADGKKSGLLSFNQRGDGPLFKMKNDPRVTRVGSIIRRFSFDEIPQLINVLRGDLSLVGPRPHLIAEVEQYSERDMLRLECIPGITCLPQVFARDTISFRQWVELDLAYRKHWSIALDLRILVRSLNEVVSPLFRDPSRRI